MSKADASAGKESLWTKSLRKLLRDRAGVAAMIVVGI